MGGGKECDKSFLNVGEFERPVNDEVVTGWLSVTIQYSHTECDGVWREGSGKPLELQEVVDVKL